jgi:putative ATPase
MQKGLFSEPDESNRKATRAHTPLAERMRPRDLDELLGQEEILGPGTPLRAAIETDTVGSLILWGPPGSGKTTLARIIAQRTASEFVPFSAVLSGIKEIRAVMQAAEQRRNLYGKKTILFIDEIHRFNKAQQDAFLPHVESGNVILIGATTENPSFEVNAALLSRCRVVVLRQLGPHELRQVMESALTDRERGLGGRGIDVPPDAMEWLARLANGDARFVLNVLEAAVGTKRDTVIALADLEKTVQRKALLYDKSGEEHFNLISALHKSLRNSDPDAGLYWLARMLEAGEDPLYIARRLVRFASEDVGLADPRALGVAVAAKDAFHFIGLPEGKLALAQSVVYLATAPKSNALYLGYHSAAEDALKEVSEPVPLHLRNPVTRDMKGWGYGKGYQYAHDFEDKTTAMDCLPENLKGRLYYRPTDEGFERTLRDRMEKVREIQSKLKSEPETRSDD